MLNSLINFIYKDHEISMSDIEKYVMFNETYGICIDTQEDDKFSIIRRFVPSKSDKKMTIHLLTSEDMYNSISGSKFPKIKNKEDVKFTFNEKHKKSVFKINVDGEEVDITIKGSEVKLIKHKQSIYRLKRKVKTYG